MTLDADDIAAIADAVVERLREAVAPPEPTFIDVKTAARLIEKSPDTVLRMCHDRGIGVRCGNIWLVDRAKLLAEVARRLPQKAPDRAA
jgi:hypothetical protein